MMLASSRSLVSRSFRRTALRGGAIAATTGGGGGRPYSRSVPVRDGDDDDGDELPYHLVVGMPALSPTMETGILAEWYVGEGSEFRAGQPLAKIETDKASLDFEAQDEGVVARILLDAGGDDVPVGMPIMVTVEEPDEVAAFADFAVEQEAAPAAAPEEPPAPTVEPVAAAPPPVAEPAAPPPPPVAEEPAAPTPPPSVEDLVAAVAPAMSTGWGNFAKLNSPIHKTLSKSQREYVERYGTTGQVPL